MKVNYLMKAIVCLFTVVALCSCSKDDDGDNSGSQTSVIKDNTITAKVEDGDDYNDEFDSVRITLGGISAIAKAEYKNGGFTLRLPETINDSEIYPQYGEGFHGHGKVNVSDPTVKTVSVDIYAYNSMESKYRFVYRTGEKMVITGTDWRGTIVYANDDISITGTFSSDEDTYDYKVVLKKGWNIVYSKSTEEGTSKYKYEITTKTPAGLKWFYRY
jgi:hypothetical protein